MSEQLTVYSTDKGEMKLSPAIVRKYLVSGDGNITDQEAMMFIALCKYQNLNPFLREAYLIKFGSSPATIVTGKEVFTKRASKNPNYDGMEAGVVIESEKGLEFREGALVLKGENLVAGWAKVYRKDFKVPIQAVASMDEYVRKKKDGSVMSNWKSMPATMIRKVSIVQALREAFPDDFQGMYSQEEMPVDASKLEDKPVNVIEVDKQHDEEQKKLDAIIEENNGKSLEALGA
jgi:phage recombination protein Bet